MQGLDAMTRHDLDQKGLAITLRMQKKTGSVGIMDLTYLDNIVYEWMSLVSKRRSGQ